MDTYLYLKAIHILAVISWMVGMLYLPRLFVYHCNKNNSEETNKIFVLMEKRLLRYIMTPAGVFTWVFGLLLFYHPSSSIDFFSFWFLIKIISVLLISAIHGYLIYCRKNLEINNNFKSKRFFKILNEVTTVLMIIVVIMIVVRPF